MFSIIATFSIQTESSCSKTSQFGTRCFVLQLIWFAPSSADRAFGPYKEAVIRGLIFTYRNYDLDKLLLFELSKTELIKSFIAARIVVNFTLAIMPIFVFNISFERVTSSKTSIGRWHGTQFQARRSWRAVDFPILCSFSVDKRVGLSPAGRCDSRSDENRE